MRILKEILKHVMFNPDTDRQNKHLDQKQWKHNLNEKNIGASLVGEYLTVYDYKYEITFILEVTQWRWSCPFRSSLDLH